MTFYIKQGDTSPLYEKQLIGSDDEPVNFSGYQDVRFVLRDEDYNILVDDDVSGNVEVVDAENGEVRYDWTTSDTTDVGTYLGEWVVIFSDGRRGTYPNDEYVEVKVTESIL